MGYVVRLTCFGVGLCFLFLGTSATWGQGLLPAGTTIVVTIIDAVDSARDPAGKQYRASVLKPVVVGADVIAPGAAAIVALTRNGADWLAQLRSVAVSGQQVAVTSASASVNSAEAGVAKGANAVNSVLKILGRPARTAQAIAAVATGQRVVLPQGTALTFVLGGGGSATAAVAPGAASAGAVPAASSAPSAAGTPSASSTPGASGTPQSAATGQLKATVTETLLGSGKGQVVVSPDGGHLATFSTHGSREVIVVDGVDGPEYDDAGRPNPGSMTIDVAFSPDGKRSAYIAQKGDQWVAVVDGKEAFTVMKVIPNVSVPGIDQTYIHRTGLGRLLPQQFLFSQSGAHVAVVGGQAREWYLFLDGVKSPPYTQIDLRQVAFAGDRLVYAAQTADQKWHMVVNDLPGPGYDGVRSLLLSENNQHYAFIGSNGATSVVVSGGATGPSPPPVTAAGGADELVIASNGRVAFLGASGTVPPGPAAAASERRELALFVAGQEVGSAILPFFGLYPATGEQVAVRVVFSPDGSKFAYARRVPGGIAAVIDGKQSIAYDGIGLMRFSPDSRRAFFVGEKTGVNFVVIDGQEMKGQAMVKNIGFSADGSRFGYETANSVVVDGKESGTYRELMDKSLTFSPDGKRVAYAACVQYAQCQLVVDGTAMNVARPGDFISRTGTPRIVFPAILFSPDGTRLAYNTHASSVLIDGREAARGLSFEFPSFSPDSKHFAVMGWTGKGMSVVVDGAVGPTYDDIIVANRNVVRFLDAHTLRFLGVRGGQVYRVVVDVK